MVNPLMEIKNYGRISSLFFCGIDVSKACLEVNYSSHKENPHELNGIVSMKVDIPNLMDILANISEEERKNTVNILDKHLKGYKKPEIPA